MNDVNGNDGGIVVSNQANANAQANATAYGGGGGGQTQRGRQVASGGGVFVGLAILLAVLYWLLGPAMFMDVLLTLSIVSSVAIVIGLVVWYHSWLKKQHYDEFFRIGQHFSQVAVDVLTASTKAQAESIKASGHIAGEAVKALRSTGALERKPSPMFPLQEIQHRLSDNGETVDMPYRLLNNSEIGGLDEDEAWQ